MAKINIENAQIRTTAVEIKTLTVSGKQVTLSVFRQIPEEKLIDPQTLKLNGIPWGKVIYFWEKQDPNDYIHLLWQKGNDLRRSIYRKNFPIDFYENNFFRFHDYSNFFGDLFKTLHKEKMRLEIITENRIHSNEEYNISMLENSIKNYKEGRCYIKPSHTLESILKDLNYKLSFALEEKTNAEKNIETISNEIEDKRLKLNDLLKNLDDLPQLFIAI